MSKQSYCCQETGRFIVLKGKFADKNQQIEINDM